MIEGRSHLEVVREDADPSTPDEAPASAGGGSFRWAVALGIVALACAIGWGLTGREASRLEAALSATEAELGLAQERIQDLDARMGEIRQRSRAMTLQMEALASESRSLEALTGPDPAAEAAPEARP
jgi:hypothetical protein